MSLAVAAGLEESASTAATLVGNRRARFRNIGPLFRVDGIRGLRRSAAPWAWSMDGKIKVIRSLKDRIKSDTRIDLSPDGKVLVYSVGIAAS
jgi:hypothetical protein